ncbi:hypothetical protein [Psychrobacillus sp. OK032]|uniref:hypothetical protein n=1 Tax=Psychrobacillus sp. OK032 TaxID=1884358 RepID=UPI0008CD5C1D|nr:hypothetical protein [Psychrobacillus sp. OK032]SES35333.1 hypothetical protein SAMN05518872_108213 [Psychrobacillus sp. OK032]
MSEEWNTSASDGEFISDGGRKNRSSKRTRIPRFRSIISKKSRKRSVGNDSEATILMWVIFSIIVSAIFHSDWAFKSLYGIFLFYTIFTKNIKPIRFVSSVILFIGSLSFIALTLVVLIDLLGDANMLQDPITRKAYTYIIGVPIISWGIIRLLENWIYGPFKKG